MESTSHLLVPFAAASAPECRALLPEMRLPKLTALLGVLSVGSTLQGDDHEFTPPHERALAHAMGLGLHDDGCFPWAATESANPQTPQAWFTPCHFQIGMDQVTLHSAESLGLGDAPSRALFEALAPYCLEDGITLRFESATRWHAEGEPLRHLICASLDRANGRSVADWTPPDRPDNPGAQLIKRLQSEAQMLFYTHAVNDQREAARQPIVNGFWVHGAGALGHAPKPAGPSPTVLDSLRQPALAAHWTAWRQAWETLDNGPIAQLLQRAQSGEPIMLTLCGERHATTWHNAAPRSAFARLGHAIQTLRGQAPAWKQLDSL
ncbi:MAG: phosphoglycerate mutase [Hydrogenophaga sp.]